MADLQGLLFVGDPHLSPRAPDFAGTSLPTRSWPSLSGASITLGTSASCWCCSAICFIIRGTSPIDCSSSFCRSFASRCGASREITIAARISSATTTRFPFCTPPVASGCSIATGRASRKSTARPSCWVERRGASIYRRNLIRHLSVRMDRRGLRSGFRITTFVFPATTTAGDLIAARFPESMRSSTATSTASCRA